MFMGQSSLCLYLDSKLFQSLSSWNFKVCNSNWTVLNFADSLFYDNYNFFGISNK